MLKDASGFSHIYVACGKTDLRKGIDGMLGVIRSEFSLDPFEAGNIFLFCGARGHLIKALVMEDDGFVLLTKRLMKGHYQWPRSKREVRDISQELYNDLMDGFAIECRSTIGKALPLYI